MLPVKAQLLALTLGFIVQMVCVAELAFGLCPKCLIDQ